MAILYLPCQFLFSSIDRWECQLNVVPLYQQERQVACFEDFACQKGPADQNGFRILLTSCCFLWTRFFFLRLSPVTFYRNHLRRWCSKSDYVTVAGDLNQSCERCGISQWSSWSNLMKRKPSLMQSNAANVPFNSMGSPCFTKKISWRHQYWITGPFRR